MYQLRRILVPTDFSYHAADALCHAVRLGAQYNAEITLLHVDEFIVSPIGALDGRADYVDIYLRKKEEFLREQFNRLIEGVKNPSVSLRWQVLPGRAHKVIVEESEKQQ